MANTPLDKQFASMGLSSNDSVNHGYESSPSNPRKLGPSIPPKPKKAQPQVPVIPKSYNIPTCLEPSYSTVLNNPNNISSSSSATYTNIHSYEDIPSGPIYGNIHREIPLSSYLPPPPPPPSDSACVDEDLPLPPPPPLHLVSDSNLYSTLEVTTDMMHFPPPPVDEMTSPPSPVSSSYSELRRAVGSTTGSTNYAPLSQGSNYESLYEPIQPRILNPDMSTLTRASGYNSPYPAYGGSSSSSAGYRTGSMSTTMTAKSPTKEAEVDALTSLLVQSMDNAVDPDFFGMCAECGMKVVGEGNGCTAMDRVFHIACFVCRMCGSRLQGKPFYAVDGEPHCQECYLNSLEKCCVCTEPILDRILRATGKPYHPRCFTCVVCGQCLDGIPFTVDAANRIHCIDDFHKKFAPRCSVCHDPIMPEPGKEETVRVVALDRSFHVNCYKCEDCGLLLSSEAEGRGCYPLDGHVLCKSCNAKRVRALTSCVSTEL